MLRRRAPYVVGLTAAALVLGSGAPAAHAGRTLVGVSAVAEVGLPPAPDDPQLLDVDPTDPTIGRREVPAAGPATSTRGLSSSTTALMAPTASTLTLSFKTSGYHLFAVAASDQPYAGQRAPRVDTKPHDANGVRKVIIDGRYYDHPVAQAQWGISNVNSYIATKDAFYLRRAIANARQIVAARVSVQTAEGTAWFFKYPFDFALHSGTAFTERAPWYSGMAQGLAISLFTRLLKVDPANAAQWRTNANAAYRSFLVRPTSTAPWVVHVDSSGYLWLDEYPVGSRPGQADLTLNGHLFAVLGLFDYYQLTGSAGALRLFDGATTMAMRYIETFRTVNWISRYCLAHSVRSTGYHRVHVGQLRLVYRMTHAGGLARESVRLDIDYPSPSVRGTVRMAKGRVTGYKFSSSGAIIGSRSLVLAAGSSAPASSRTRIQGRGIYLSISSGYFKGYAVAEVPDRAYLTGTVTLGVWAAPPRTFAYTTSSQVLGRPAGSGVVSGEVFHSDALALIGGRLWYHIVDGRNAGTYVLYGTVTIDV
jgi:hypothetical protein